MLCIKFQVYGLTKNVGFYKEELIKARQAREFEHSMDESRGSIESVLLYGFMATLPLYTRMGLTSQSLNNNNCCGIFILWV